MPSRKRDRGKQRKAAKQNNNVRAPQTTGASDGPGVACVRLAPQGTPGRDKVESGIGEFKALGCQIIMCDDGSSTARHPCFDHIHNKDMGNFLDIMRDFDRGLLNDDQRKELAGNYVHNYAQDLREGDFHGTELIIGNVADPHIGPQLGDELLKADIHVSMLHFLNQSDRSVSDVLGGAMGAEESIKLPSYWVGIIRMLIGDGVAEDTMKDAQLAVAKGIEPFLMSVIGDKRELFQSNHTWHLCLSSFFDIMHSIMKSKEGFSVMTSYEGFLPFVAQASCWSQSREDIVVERDFFRCHHRCDSLIAPEPIGEICYDAQRAIASILLTLKGHYGDIVEEAEMREALEQIACAPLCGNNSNCTDSTMVGFVRMMAENIDKDSRSILWYILQPLLFKCEYVDAGVIAEFIEYGRRNSSMVAAQTVLKTLATILGRNDSFKRINMIDSRYAAAVRHGLLEFCIDALVAYGNESGCDIAPWLYYIAMGVWSMALHSKTSRALRERQAELMTALDVLRKHSTTSRFNAICTLIDGAIDLSDPATCCNCLKEVDRKDLLYCKRCGVECYCSPACQSESFAMGHDGLCKEEVAFVDGLREEGFSETKLKRLEVLKCNLMMNGCRLIRRKAAEILGKYGNVAEVGIKFEGYPPEIGVLRGEEDDSESSDTLKCRFRAPVYYGFAEKADLKDIVVHTFISKRSLALANGPRKLGNLGVQ